MYGMSYRSAASEAGPTRLEPNPPTMACTFSTPASFSTAATAFGGLLSSSYTRRSTLTLFFFSNSSAASRIPLIFSAPLLARLPVCGSWTPNRMAGAAEAPPHSNPASTAAIAVIPSFRIISPPFPDIVRVPSILTSSLPREYGLALLEEGGEPLLFILRPHRDGGQPVLVPQPFLQRHSEPGEDRVLCQPDRHGPLRGDRLREGDRLVEEAIRGHDLRNDPELQRLLRREDPRGQDHLERTAHPDQPRKTLGAPAGGEDPQVDFRQADGGVLRRDPDRAGERHLETAPEGIAVDRGDDGLGAPFQDEIDPVALEHIEHPAGGALEQRADVRTGAERLGPRAGQHDRPDGRVGHGRADFRREGVPQFVVEGIADFRAVELQDPDRPPVFLQEKSRALRAHRLAPSP